MPGSIITDNLKMRQGAAAATPAVGQIALYWKTGDETPYIKDSGGVEYAVLLASVPTDDLVIVDNQAGAWGVREGTNDYLRIRTSNGAEIMTLGADPVTVTTAQLHTRGGLGGWVATSTGGMTLDAVAALELNSSTGAINIANDAVNQAVNIATAGTRTVTVGNSTATLVTTGASHTWNIKDNVAAPLTIKQGTDNYLALNTTDGTEAISFGNAVTNPDFFFLGTGPTDFAGPVDVNGAFTLTGSASYSQTAGNFTYNATTNDYIVNASSAAFAIANNNAAAWEVKKTLTNDSYIKVSTLSGSERITLGSYNVHVAQGLYVDGTAYVKLGVASGVEAYIGGYVYANDDVSSLVQNTAVETAFNKQCPQFPANTFVPGRKLKIRAAGTVVDTNGNDGNQQVTLRIKLLEGAGPTHAVLFTLQFNANANNVWSIDYCGHVLSTGTAGTRTLRQLMEAGAGASPVARTAVQNASPTFAADQPETLQITAQWQNQHVDNKVRLDFLEVELG